MTSIRRKSKRDVQPLGTLAGYQGGKRVLGKHLAAVLDAIPHRCYVEAFFGMGGVFFRREHAAKVEVINDLSRDVVNLFRVVQRHPEALADILRWQVSARLEFERLVAVDPGTLTDIERAARFLILQKLAFGGRLRNRSFGVSTTYRMKLTVSRLVERLAETHERLQGVVIEHLPALECIARYDRPATLFYLDPPYWGCERDYPGEGWARGDFERLAEQLTRIKGRFVLSLNDLPETRALFSGFAIQSIQSARLVAGSHEGRDLIITDGRDI